MKNKVFDNKGITLVALVITIIILLILAGISIAQLTGNGLFENAKLAKEKSENAQRTEQDKLLEYANEINKNINQIRYDDYKKLLSIVGIQTSKTLEQVLEDSEMLEIIFNNKEAIEYIRNSDKVILPAIYNSEKGIEKLLEKSEKSDILTNNERIENSSYHVGIPFHAFDGNTTTAWRPAPGEAITNSYITYDNLTNKRCFRIDITWDYTVKDGIEFYYIFQGSTDNENWEDITTEQLHKYEGTYSIYTTNDTPYRYFRYQGVSGTTMHSASVHSARIVELVYYFI